MPSGIALVKVYLPSLRDILKLPENVKLLRVRQSWEDERQLRFEILVESPNLPLLAEGAPIPYARILVHTDPCIESEVSCA